MSKHEQVPPVSSPRLAMIANSPTVLLAEDDCTDAGSILEALTDAEGGSFRVEWVTCLSDAVDRLARGGIDVVLLGLTLPDGEGMEAFDRVYQVAPAALILLLSAADDAETARRTLRSGTHDYVAKGHAVAYWLPCALRYVTERRATERVLRQAEETLFEEKERSRVTLWRGEGSTLSCWV